MAGELPCRHDASVRGTLLSLLSSLTVTTCPGSALTEAEDVLCLSPHVELLTVSFVAEGLAGAGHANEVRMLLLGLIKC